MVGRTELKPLQPRPEWAGAAARKSAAPSCHMNRAAGLVRLVQGAVQCRRLARRLVRLVFQAVEEELNWNSQGSRQKQQIARRCFRLAALQPLEPTDAQSVAAANSLRSAPRTVRASSRPAPMCRFMFRPSPFGISSTPQNPAAPPVGAITLIRYPARSLVTERRY